jgi:hypothetical protein
MFSRRSFLGSIVIPAAFASGAITSKGMARTLEALEAYRNVSTPPEEMAVNADFWIEVQQAFTVDRSVLNLNTISTAEMSMLVELLMRFCFWLVKSIKGPRLTFLP